MGSRATTLACYAAAVIIAISIMSYVGMTQIQTLEQKTARDIESDVRSVAYDASKRMSDIASIMEVTAKLPQVMDVSEAHLITIENKGVPQDAAVEKRKVAQNIIASNIGVDAIGFIHANGDMYLEEPYPRQQSLTRTNFADRDYFKGAIATGGPYVGEMYISAATGKSIAALAVPVYSDDGSLAAVWAAYLNLDVLNSRASEVLGSEYGGRAVYIDQKGHEVVYSSELVSADETLSDLQSYADALAGRSGSRAEMHSGTQMYVAYSPVEIPGATWVILAMQPYGEAFSPAPMLMMQGAIIVVSVIAAGLGFVIYRSKKT